MSCNSPNSFRKTPKKSQTKKMSVYSMVPTLFILERPSPYKNLNSSRTINNQKQHPLAESYPPINSDSSLPDKHLNRSSSIEDFLGDSERTSYKLTVTSNNDEIASSIGKIDGHLKRNCGLELTMEESKEELEINMKFATRCLISSLNIEFLTTAGKPKKLYTPRSAKSSREFSKCIIHEEPEVYNNDVITSLNENSTKKNDKYLNIGRDRLKDSLNSTNDRFKEKSFNKDYNREDNNYRHSTLSKSERVYIPLNDIKNCDSEDDEAQDVVGELRGNDDCIPFPSLSQLTPEEPKGPPNTPDDGKDTIPFPSGKSNTKSTSNTADDSIPFPSSKSTDDSIPFPSSNTNNDSDSIPFPSSKNNNDSIPFPSSNTNNDSDSIPFPSSNTNNDSETIPFPSSKSNNDTIPFPSNNNDSESIPFPSSKSNNDSIPFPSSNTNNDSDSIPFPSSNTNNDSDSIPFPSSNTNNDTIPFPSSNSNNDTIPFPSSNSNNDTIPFPSSNSNNDTIPFPFNRTNKTETVPEIPVKLPEVPKLVTESTSDEPEPLPVFPKLNPKIEEIKSEEFPSVLSESNNKGINNIKRSSSMPRSRAGDTGLQKKLGCRKGRRRSISSPPPPFPDLNTTLNIPSNDESENVLCHLRDIEVQVTYMKGYSSYTPQVTQVSRNVMNYDNKNVVMKDKEAKVLIYEFRIIGIADGVNIKIKKKLDPLSDSTRLNLDPLKLIRIAGVNVYASPQPKMVMPLMNMVSYLEINNHPKTDIIDAHILLGLALHSSHKSVQGIEIINKALDIIKYLLISGEIFKQSNMTFHSHLAQTPFTITSKSEIFLYTLSRMAKLESLIAEMEYVRTRESESIPHFIEISRLWKYYLKAQDVDDKKRIDEIIEEIFKTPKENNPLLSRLSSPAEVIYNLQNLPDFFLFVLNDNRDPAIYFRSMSLSAIQFIIDTSGCSVGSEYSKICQHLFLNYSLWDDNQQLNDQSSDIDEGSNRKSIENTPLSMTFERGGWINQLFYVLESCYKLIPEFSNEVLREFIEEWAFPAAVALNRTQGAIIQLYRFLCSAFLNIEGYDILISNPFLDAVISDLIGNGTLSIAAGRFWAVLVEKTLTVIEKHNTGLILKYVTDRICQMLCDETSVVEGEICLLLDIICRIASKVKNIEDDPLKDEIACSFVTVSGVLLDTFEISIIDRYPDMFVTLWQTFRLSVEIIPQNFKGVVAQAIASVLRTFTKKLNDCAPTPKATKALYNILRYIQPDDQIIQLAVEILPPFSRSIPHSIDSHQLDVLRELVIICSKAIKDRKIMEEMINALFDKFTVRSENFERTLRFLAALTMTRLTPTGKTVKNKVVWKFEWLEWVLEICLFENLIPEGIFHLDTVNDTKELETTHQLFIEKLKYLKSLISILKPYHVKLNFETINLESSFITRYSDIAGCCFLLLGHPDIHVICLAYEIMVGISTNIIKINSIRNYPNDNLLNVLDYYPAFLIKTLKRFLHDKEMVLSCLSAIIWMYQTLGEIELTDEEYAKIYPESLWDVCINVLKSPFRETSARSIDLISVIFNFINIQLLSTRGWKGINIILLYLLNHGSWKRRLTGIKLLYILARRWPTYIHPHEDLIERTKEAHEKVIVLQDDGRDAVRNAATHLFLMYNSPDVSVISELLIQPPDLKIIPISMTSPFTLPEIPSEDGIIKLALDYQEECKTPNTFNFCDHPKRIPSYFEIDLGYYQYVEPLDLVYECPEIDIASTPQTLKEFTEFPGDDFYINYIMEKNKLRWVILNEPQNTVEQIEYNTGENIDEFDEYTQ